MASPGLVAAVVGVSSLFAAGRNQQMKEKSGATTAMRNANAEYIQQKQEARDKNQAPNAADLDKAKQNAVFDLQRRSGRQSTFLSNGLGG